jgi:hypothetical protein
MKLKLKVLDPKQKKLTIKDLIEKKIPIRDLDDRWNLEMEFEVPERLILQLVEEIIDKIMDSNQLYYHEANDKTSSLKRDISANDANNFIKSARAWRKIHIMISDQGFQTSRFTRLSLFEIILNIPEMKKRMENKLHDMEQEKSNQGKKIPEEKQSQLAPTTAPKIQESIFTEFTKKITKEINDIDF